MKFTASIVSHQQFDLCLKAINSLLTHIVDIEIILTINTQENYILPDSLKNKVKIIQNNEMLGFGENHNNAFQISNGEYFIIVNPDIEISSWKIVKLDKKTLYTGVIYYPDNTICDNLRKIPSLLNLFKRRFMGIQDDKIEWLAGMFLIIHKDFFKILGGFDENFYMYLEDTDLSLRVKINNGHLKVIDSIILYHDARRDSNYKLGFFFTHLKSLIYFYIKYPRHIFF